MRLTLLYIKKPVQNYVRPEFCHSREGGNPVLAQVPGFRVKPGMTERYL